MRARKGQPHRAALQPTLSHRPPYPVVQSRIPQVILCDPKILDALLTEKICQRQVRCDVPKGKVGGEEGDRASTCVNEATG